MISPRLLKQISFLKEIDQLKTVIRQSLIIDGSRQENSAEHSWHFAMAVCVLSEYSNEKIDPLKTIKMALIHDIVEVYAGDTFVYDENARANKAEKEREAAIEIFSFLPEDTAQELHCLWLEYEDHKSPEAKFALAIDRVMPILCNLETEGHSWKKHGVKKHQVLAKTESWKNTAPQLHEYINEQIEDAAEKGYL